MWSVELEAVPEAAPAPPGAHWPQHQTYRLIERLFADGDVAPIRLDDPRFRWLIRHYGESSEELESLEELVNALADDPNEDRTELDALLENLIEYVEDLRAGSLEGELFEILSGLLEPSHLPAMLNRFGWVTGSPVTLAEAGEQAGVTRERIRQIQVRLEQTLQGTEVWTPVLDRALRSVTENAPLAASEFNDTLRAAGLIESEGFDPEGLVIAQELFARESDLERVVSQGTVYIVQREDASWAQQESDREHLRQLMSKLVGEQGVASVDQVLARYDEETALTAQDVVEMAEGMPSIAVHEAQYLIPMDVHTRNPLVNRLHKLFAVLPEASLSLISAQLQRNLRPGRGYPATEGEIRAFATVRPDLEFDGAVVRPVDTVHAQDALSAGELAIHDVLRTRQDPARFEEVVDVVQTEGLSRVTIAVILASSPIVHRFGERGLYEHCLISQAPMMDPDFALAVAEPAAEPVPGVDEEPDEQVAEEAGEPSAPEPPAIVREPESATEETAETERDVLETVVQETADEVAENDHRAHETVADGTPEAREAAPATELPPDARKPGIQWQFAIHRDGQTPEAPLHEPVDDAEPEDEPDEGIVDARIDADEVAATSERIEGELTTELRPLSTLIDDMQTGVMTLPEIQRDYVWKPAQVVKLIDSLYRHYPVGNVLVWETESKVASRSVGDARPVGTPHERYLLDGQQRLTSLRRLFREDDPEKRLVVMFNPVDQSFAARSAQRTAARGWISVRDVLEQPVEQSLGMLKLVGTEQAATVRGRLERLRQILDFDMPVATLRQFQFDEVVDIFVRVNSQGTSLKKAELALATLAFDVPGMVHNELMAFQAQLDERGWHIDHLVLLRCLTAYLTHRSGFSNLSTVDANSIVKGWAHVKQGVTRLVDFLERRLGLRSADRPWLVSSSLLVLPVTMLSDERHQKVESGRLLRWFLLASAFSRYTGPSETRLDQDLAAVHQNPEDPWPALDNLLRGISGRSDRRLEISTGQLEGEQDRGGYMLLVYAALRHAQAKDLWTYKRITATKTDDEPLKVQPIFTSKGAGVSSRESRDIANQALLIDPLVRSLATSSPYDLLADVDTNLLTAQGIPTDPELWSPRRYRGFLSERRRHLAELVNELLQDLVTDEEQ